MWIPLALVNDFLTYLSKGKKGISHFVNMGPAKYSKGLDCNPLCVILRWLGHRCRVSFSFI